jgi:dimethylamine/trimethylamine dehydrogenase
VFAFNDGVSCRQMELASDHVVFVSSRQSVDSLVVDVRARRAEWADAGVERVSALGDALAPGMIVHAIYAGHRYARELDMVIDPDAVPFRRDLPR